MINKMKDTEPKQKSEPVAYLNIQSGIELSSGKELHHTRECKTYTNLFLPINGELLPLGFMKEYELARSEGYIRDERKPTLQLESVARFKGHEGDVERLFFVRWPAINFYGL